MASWTTQRAAPARSSIGLRAALAAPLTWPAASLIVALLLGLVAATNRWMSFAAGFVYARADDERAYLTIARAAPDLPADQIADQHAQRWPLHWLIGSVSDPTGIAPETLYGVAALALAVAMLLVLCAVLMRLGASTATTLLCLAVVALNPYALRYYALAPAYLVDLALELGVAVALLGLLTRRLPLVLAGALLGVVSRQTMLPLLPLLAAWVAFAPAWRGGNGRARLARATAVFALPLAAFLVVKAVAAGFSRPSISFSRLTILDHVAALPGTAGDLVNHFSHVAIVLLPVTGLLVALLVRTRLRDLPFVFWGCLAIGVVIVAQAAALNPDPVFNDYSSSNEPRLTALALGSLAVAIAAARPAVEPRLLLLALGALFLASFHQDLTILSTGSAGVTFALQALAGVVLGVAVWLSDQRTIRRPVRTPNGSLRP